jgi:hypothetical protein
MPLRSRPPRVGGALAELPDAPGATRAVAFGWDTFLDRLERDLAETMFDVMSDSGSALDSDSALDPASDSASNSGLNSDPAPAAGPARAVSQVWVPPVGLGPLPARLEDRARALVAATADARAELAARHLEVGRHLAAVQSVPPAVGSRPPVYLDVAS